MNRGTESTIQKAVRCCKYPQSTAFVCPRSTTILTFHYFILFFYDIIIIENRVSHLPSGELLERSYLPISKNRPCLARQRILACSFSSAREFRTTFTPETDLFNIVTPRKSVCNSASGNVIHACGKTHYSDVISITIHHSFIV